MKCFQLKEIYVKEGLDQDFHKRESEQEEDEEEEEDGGGEEEEGGRAEEEEEEELVSEVIVFIRESGIQRNRNSKTSLL